MKLEINYKRIAQWVLGVIITLFLILNIIVAIQAYSFTHFKEDTSPLDENKNMSNTDITYMILTGVTIPRPQTKAYPKLPYDSILISAGGDKSFDAWVIKTEFKKRGIMLLFHGYMDEKSLLLNYAYEFIDMGYDVLLIDFMGSGGSYGNQSTIGYKEAEAVKITVEYTKNNLKEDRIFLMGFSMGAAAILKAQHDYGLPVNGIIAEASYGKLFDTIRARAELIGLGKLSKFGTYLFTFWMSATNFIDAFDMNPDEYVKNITTPTLIACGGKDQYIPKKETQRIYDNLKSKHKKLKFYPECKHELYIHKYPNEWRETTESFLNSVK